MARVEGAMTATRRTGIVLRARAASALATGMVLLVPGAVQAADPIQPGAQVRTSIGLCTLSWVYDGVAALKGRTFVTTAGHCVGALGDTIAMPDQPPLGRVVLIGDHSSPEQDFTLIEVDPAVVTQVDPAMKAHPDLPTGVTTAADTAPGDLVQMSSYGYLFNETQEGRERRVAVLGEDDDQGFGMLFAPWTSGDSGGPLAHLATGRALGIVSGLQLPNDLPNTGTGPTVEGILRHAAAAGLPIELRTAAEGPPPAPATAPPASAPSPPAPAPAPSSASAPAPPSRQTAPRPTSKTESRPGATRKRKLAERRRRAARRCNRFPRTSRSYARCRRAASRIR